MIETEQIETMKAMYMEVYSIFYLLNSDNLLDETRG